MQATRQQILDFLREHGEATVRTLSAHLELTATGVRQHLTILEGEGLIDTRELRGRVGRPSLAYRLTHQAEALYPKGYDRLALAVISSARRRLPEREFSALLQDAAQTLARPNRDRVGHGTPEERVSALCDVLREQENVVEYERTAEGYIVRQRTCPYHDAAEASSATCDLDVALLGALTDLPVELRQVRTADDAMCCFLVRTRPPGDPSDKSKLPIRSKAQPR